MCILRSKQTWKWKWDLRVIRLYSSHLLLILASSLITHSRDPAQRASNTSGRLKKTHCLFSSPPYRSPLTTTSPNLSLPRTRFPLAANAGPEGSFFAECNRPSFFQHPGACYSRYWRSVLLLSSSPVYTIHSVSYISRPRVILSPITLYERGMTTPRRLPYYPHIPPPSTNPTTSQHPS